MKKFTLLSVAAIAALATEPVMIQKITVEASTSKGETKSIAADEMVKFSRQSDLGEMLSQTLPEITHVRNSGVGNDIILRGFRKDNINVTIDDLGSNFLITTKRSTFELMNGKAKFLLQ